MRNSGFFKLSELVTNGTLQTSTRPEGIPGINQAVTPTALGNTAMGAGADVLKQYPGIIGDVGHVITDTAPAIKRALPTIKSFAGHPVVQNVLRSAKTFVNAAPKFAPAISVASGANRLVKGDSFGAGLDGLSAAAGGLVARRLASRGAAYAVPYAGETMMLADIANLYRDSGGVPPAMNYKNVSTPGSISGGSRITVDSPSTPTSKAIIPPQPPAPVGTQLISGGVSRNAPVPPARLQPKTGSFTQREQKAFIIGMQKRAAQLGLDKEAFIAPLLAGAIDLAGSFGGAHLLTKGLGRLAAMKNMGAVGKGAKKFYNWTQSPGTTMGPLVGNMAMMTASDMATRPILSPIKRMLGLEQPEAPQYR
jgi:hypothetical protein